MSGVQLPAPFSGIQCGYCDREAFRAVDAIPVCVECEDAFSGPSSPARGPLSALTYPNQCIKEEYGSPSGQTLTLPNQSAASAVSPLPFEVAATPPDCAPRLVEDSSPINDVKRRRVVPNDEKPLLSPRASDLARLACLQSAKERMQARVTASQAQIRAFTAAVVDSLTQRCEELVKEADAAAAALSAVYDDRIQREIASVKTEEASYTIPSSLLSICTPSAEQLTSAVSSFMTSSSVTTLTVDPHLSSVYGPGINGYYGGASPVVCSNNTFNLVCCDSLGSLLPCISPEDVDVVVEGASSTTGPFSPIPPSLLDVTVSSTDLPGTLRVLYHIHQPSASFARFLLTVDGVLLAECPIVVPRIFGATGEYVSSFTIPLLRPKTPGNFGLAVSRNGQWAAVSNSPSHTVFLLEIMPLPSPPRMIVALGGMAGCGPCQFDGPAKMCYTPHCSLLVIENRNKRVQELSHTGEHIRFLFVDMVDSGTAGIASDGDIVVVGNDGSKDFQTNSCISVFSYSSGALLRHFGRSGYGPGDLGCISSLRLLPDSALVLIAQTSHRALSLMSVHGDTLQRILLPTGSSPWDVDLTATSDPVTVDTNRHQVCVYSRADGGLLRAWGRWGDGPECFRAPIGLAVSCGLLYVLDHEGGRVQVFY